MNGITQQLASGQLSVVTIILWTVLAFLLSVAAGAVAGMKLGGKDLGTSLAAMMGGMYGPVAAAPGILLGLIILAFV